MSCVWRAVEGRTYAAEWETGKSSQFCHYCCVNIRFLQLHWRRYWAGRVLSFLTLRLFHMFLSVMVAFQIGSLPKVRQSCFTLQCTNAPLRKKKAQITDLISWKSSTCFHPVMWHTAVNSPRTSSSETHPCCPATLPKLAPFGSSKQIQCGGTSLFVGCDSSATLPVLCFVLTGQKPLLCLWQNLQLTQFPACSSRAAEAFTKVSKN